MANPAFAKIAARRFKPAEVDPAVARYFHDPVAWANDFIMWRPGEGLTDYQRGNLSALVEHKRVAVRGPHGLGKSMQDAVIVLWFADTRERAGIDWKVVTTASVWRQLTEYLWPEIHKWVRRLNWTALGRRPFKPDRELQTLSLKLRYGEAFAVASDNPSNIEGAHATQMLYVFDEAKTILGDTFDAAEGAFTTDEVGEHGGAYAIANSTPGEPSGRFYDIHSRKPGYEDWHPIHVTLQDAISAGRIGVRWAQQRKLQWGEESAVYQNRVLGEFASSDEDAVIPLRWVEAANERWRAWRGDPDSPMPDLGPMDALGVDVAREGRDKTVFAPRHGVIVPELLEFAKQDTAATTGRVRGILNANRKAIAKVDVIGIGAGVVDHLRGDDTLDTVHIAPRVDGFHASKGTKLLDRTGELGFSNVRSAAWWNLRELLDPANGFDICLPPHDQLTGDLTAPKWRVVSGGRIQVESKDDIKKRLGRSTDHGDAVIQAYWHERDQAAGFIEAWTSITAKDVERNEHEKHVPSPVRTTPEPADEPIDMTCKHQWGPLIGGVRCCTKCPARMEV